MKPFNLQDFISNPSRNVVTRDGRQVRIICTDAKREYPIIALIEYEGKEYIGNYLPDGKLCSESTYIGDLFFDVEEKNGWVNIYKIPDTDELETSIIFNTKEEAEFHSVDNPNYVSTAKIQWDE